MRAVVHDYCGHPFQVQLSRELARRGHEVLHLHCPSVGSGRGALERTPDDPPSFTVDGVVLDTEFEKYRAGRRLRQEREYGRRLVRRVEAFAPDVVLSANTPLFSQAALVRSCEVRGRRLVFWQQDVLGVGIKAVLSRKLPGVGTAVGQRFVALERRLLRRSDAVVAISEDFRPELLAAGVAPERVHVIENWAPLHELPPRPRHNEWATRHGLGDKRVLLYSGTLGLKHNPELLLRLAHRFRSEHDVRVVVVSEGLGADWLRARAAEDRLHNLILLGFQPYAELPDALASGDVLIAILEHDAGVFSVPSKVLSYFCAERALLGAIPGENLAARLIDANDAGVAVDPLDADAFVAAAGRLLADGDLRARLAANARRYAEATFDITRIGDRFEAVLAGVTATPRPVGTAAGAQSTAA